MSKNNMTLKELAKIIGVSISTVSKALNDSPEISKTTINKIKELAKLNNYQPNRIAVNLKSGKTNTIGVVLPSIQNNFFAKVLNGIEDVIAETPYNIIISITDESHEKEVNSIETLSNGVVDGFIIAVSEETQINKEIQHFKSALNFNKEIVMFDRVISSLDVDKVIVDDKEAVYNVVKRLINDGRTTVALVSSIFNLSVGKYRTKGYREAVTVANDELIIEDSVENLNERLLKMLSSHKIDAIVALDEDASLEAVKAARMAGIDVPNDMAIIGYASDKLASNITPALSTIDQHGVLIGKKAAELILSKLKNSDRVAEEHTIETSIIERETTKK